MISSTIFFVKRKQTGQRLSSLQLRFVCLAGSNKKLTLRF